MISQTAEHALRAVLFLARQPGQGSVPADAIAAALGAPRNYLSKTLQQLARAGIVVGTRGPTGGFRLAVPADTLSVAELVEVFDEEHRSGMCLLGGTRCTGESPCAAHFNWKAVTAEARAPLERTVIADLLRDVGAEHPATADPPPTRAVHSAA
ncbi:MAG TPA: Rrf2 family transcriptional regulator [Longimicrobiales bacterium]|nr:Rrf2 family transcriptional regulator [Longimicrobiales bacterium]